MKKVFLITAIFMLALGISVSAEELLWGEININEFSEYDAESDDMTLFAMSSNERTAVDVIIRGIVDRKTQIRLGSYNVKTDRINHVVQWAMNEKPELCYVDTSWRYGYFGDTVELIYLEYPYTDAQIDNILDFIEAEKQKVLGMVDDSMTELEKVMLVHNYVVTNHEYDYDYEIYDIYGFFRQRKGVCSAYTKAMTYLLRAMDIECSFARSDSMAHIWNLVKISGYWYHVDATWDDPNDRIGYCSYKYFLKSDSYFEEYCGHYNWESEYAATSAWYDDYYFDDYYTPFIYCDGDWYVQKNGRLYKKGRLEYGTVEEIYTPDYDYRSGWSVWSNHMNFGVYEDWFIYNTYNGVYAVNLKDYAKARKIITYDNTNCEIYSLTVWDGRVYYQTGENSGSDNKSVFTVFLDPYVSEFCFEIVNVSVSSRVLRTTYTYDDLYDGDWKIYVAAYDEDNIMICINELVKNTYTQEVPEADRYEVFIWEGCMPLCDSVEYK